MSVFSSINYWDLNTSKTMKYLTTLSAVIIQLILLSSCSSNTFSKRKYRKGVFMEHSVNSRKRNVQSKKLDMEQNAIAPSLKFDLLAFKIDDTLALSPNDSVKLQYIQFRKKLNEKPNRLAKRRFHKKWLKDSLMKFDSFKILKKSEQRAFVKEQYKIERIKEIQDLRAIQKAIEDSIHPGQTRREYKNEQIEIFRKNIKKAQTKTTRKHTKLGISTLPVMGVSLIGSLFILGFEAYLLFIGVGLALFTMFSINLIAYKRNKKEFEQIKNPDEYTEHVYRKSRRMNVLGMFLSIGAMIIITLFFLFYWFIIKPNI